MALLPYRFRRPKSGTSNKMSGWLALSPLLVFFVIYVTSALFAHSFYTVPISVPFIFASIYAVAITHRYETTAMTINIFSDGTGNKNVLLMVWIILLAGAFAGTSKDIGAINAVANAITNYLPGSLLYFGLFLASCLVSMAMGSNVGTIVALVPIAVGIAEGTGINLPLLVAIIVGGGSFGDNLSFISDTTIAATTTLGCSLRDKFRVNILIAGPAALLVCFIYIVLGHSVVTANTVSPINWVALIPYLTTIVLAMAGINVLTVLSFGVLLNGVIGIIQGSYNAIGWMCAIGEGVAGVSELIVVIMLAGGMLEVIRYNGGIDFLAQKVTKGIVGKRTAELSIAALVSLATFCTANNTIAVLTTSKMARGISEKHGLNAMKTASILDTFSCIVQILLPYGLQLLMASALAHVGIFAIIKHLYYPFVLFVFSMLAILLRFPRKYS